MSPYPEYTRSPVWGRSIRNKPHEPVGTGPGFFQGCIIGLLLCAPFWGAIIALVWVANKLIGGG